MNTSSVSMNKSIPESSKIEVKSKGNKSEESFKDMIKNVSLNEKKPEKSNQITKGAKDSASTNLSDAQEEDGAVTKVDVVSTSNLASLVINSPCILDSVQLTKAISLSAEGQVEAVSAGNGQNSSNQTGLVEIVTNSKPDIEGMQVIPLVKGTAEKQVIPQIPLQHGAQVKGESTNSDKQIVMSKPQVDANPTANQQKGATTLKQDVLAGEQHKSSMVSQEADVLDSNAITTSELKLLNQETAADNVITIKVGEPSLTSSWKQVAEEIGNMIVEKVNHEVQKVNITLNPKDLGEIDVEFLINKGKILVSLNCSNEGTKSLLTANLDSLTKIVQSSLMQDVNVNLNHDKTENNHNPNSENFDGRGNNGHYQGDSQNKKKDQEQPNLDFIQRLRLGIEDIESSEV